MAGIIIRRAGSRHDFARRAASSRRSGPAIIAATIKLDRFHIAHIDDCPRLTAGTESSATVNEPPEKLTTLPFTTEPFFSRKVSAQAGWLWPDRISQAGT